VKGSRHGGSAGAAQGEYLQTGRSHREGAWRYGKPGRTAWLLQDSPVILPILGTLRGAHLEEHVVAAALSLTPQEISQLGAAA
jgi:hypothetical protein